MFSQKITCAALAVLALWQPGVSFAQEAAPPKTAQPARKATVQERRRTPGRIVQPPSATTTPARPPQPNPNPDFRPYLPPGMIDPASPLGNRNIPLQVQGGYRRVDPYFDRSLGPMGDRKVSLEVDRSEPMEAIVNVLRSAGVDYVIGGDVTGKRKVTAHFQNVRLVEALDALATAAGLGYHTRGEIVVLMSEPPMPGAVGFMPGGPFPNNSGRVVRTPEGKAYLDLGDGELEVLDSNVRFHLQPTEEINTPLPQARVTEVIRLANQKVEDLANVVPPHLDLHVAIDAARNSIVATGNEQMVTEFKSMLLSMDQNVPKVMLKIYAFHPVGKLPQEWFNIQDGKREVKTENTSVKVLPAPGPIEELVKKIQDQGGRLVISPSLMTLSGREAEIQVATTHNVGGTARSVQLVPNNQPRPEPTPLPRIESHDTHLLPAAEPVPDRISVLPEIIGDDRLQLTLTYRLAFQGASQKITTLARSGEVLAVMGNEGKDYLLLVSPKILREEVKAIQLPPPPPLDEVTAPIEKR